jgi:hypothetical protein
MDVSTDSNAICLIYDAVVKYPILELLLNLNYLNFHSQLLILI